MNRFRKAIAVQWKGLRLSREISGRHFLLYETLSNLLPHIATYTSAYFSGLVITALTENAPFAVPFRYALYAVSTVLLLWFIRRLCMRQTMTLRRTMFFRREMMLTRKALELDFAQAENPEIAALLGRVEDNSDQFMGIAMQTRQLGDLFSSVLSIAIAVAMGSRMVFSHSRTPQTGILRLADSSLFGVLFALLILVLILVSIVFRNAGVRRRFRLHEKNGKINAVWKYYYDRVLNESGSGEDIRIYHEKPLIYEEMGARVFNEKKRLYNAFLRIDCTFGTVPAVITAVLGSAVYLFVALKALGGAFGAGKVVEYYAVLTQMIGSFSQLALGLGLMHSNRAHLEEDLSFFELRAQMRCGTRTVDDIDPENAVFAFENVSFRYPGTEPLVLDGLNLTIRAGERLAVVGRNGSGKSTMVKLLCRLYDPTDGVITLNGIDIREFDYTQYLRLFGIVFQDFHLLAFSVAENVACSTAYDEARVKECLHDAGLSERIARMENGIRQCVTKLYDETGVDLSGGEAQKLAIARALYKGSPFIILDEPTAALDPKSESEIYARFDEMTGDRTAVYISHRMSSCRFCDRIAVFQNGRIAEQGTHEALLQMRGEYAQLWNAQAQHYTR